MSRKAAAASAPDLSEALARLRRGEMTLDAYLDECVEGAIAHLKGQLDDDALESVRESIRAAARMDPILMDVVERITRRDPDLPASG
ncbi:MAG TPA: hypothetical protein VF103_12785 [Polyangiaceae bacterium]